jgi:hypothetical protein
MPSRKYLMLRSAPRVRALRRPRTGSGASRTTYEADAAFLLLKDSSAGMTRTRKHYFNEEAVRERINAE